MIPKKKKTKNFQNIFSSILFLILFLGISIFLIVSNLRINKRRQELLNQIENLQTEIQSLEEKNENLNAGISQTQTESYWEEKMREQGYKKPGETQVVVIPPEEEEEKTKIEESPLEKILKFLKFWER